MCSRSRVNTDAEYVGFVCRIFVSNTLEEVDELLTRTKMISYVMEFEEQ